jgi:LysR family glycine cleavage system transcriptional activator
MVRPVRNLPPLNPLLAFEATSRHLSFTKAAQELNVTQGAVSRQVAVLEEFFGVPLFERHRNGIVLTRNATTFAAAVSQAFGDLRGAMEAYVAAAARPSLSVKAYTVFLNRWLMPRLPGFARQNPNIDVRLLGTSGASHVDFAKDRVDVGIRYGHGHWSDLNSHLLFRDELMPVCAPDLARRLRSTGPAGLAGQVLLQTHAREADWPDWLKLAGVPAGPALKRARLFEDLGIVYECALDGVGIAIMQHAYVRDDLAAGRLAAPFVPVLRRPLGYYLVYPTDRAGVPEIKLFRHWLLKVVGSPSRAAGTLASPERTASGGAARRVTAARPRSRAAAARRAAVVPGPA